MNFMRFCAKVNLDPEEKEKWQFSSNGHCLLLKLASPTIILLLERSTFTTRVRTTRKAKGKQLDVLQTSLASDTASTLSYPSQTPSAVEASCLSEE